MTNGQRKMYQFLIEAHCNSMNFTSKMLKERSGLKRSTIDTYIRKKLINYYIVKRDDEYITTDKLNSEGEKQFEEHMSQTHPSCKM